jgi:hypothetical protein
MTYASSDELVAYLRIPAGVEDSTLLQVALEGADEAINGYIDQELLSGTATNEEHNGDGSDVLQLRHFPAIAIASITEWNPGFESGTSATLDSTDYYAELHTGIVYRIGSKWPEGRGTVKVTYTYGVEETPADVRIVALQVAARIYDVGMVENESVGGVSATYVKGAGSLTEDERRLLRRYRRTT